MMDLMDLMDQQLEPRQLQSLVGARRTPFYLFDFDQVRRWIRGMREMMGEEIGLCYAMKANSFLVSEIAGSVDRIEVCSMGEYRICRRYRIPVEKLYISGVLKEPGDIWEILTETGGKSRYTVESPAQYLLIAAWAEEHEIPIRIYPRLTSGNQFGMDRGQVREILRQAEEHPYLTVEGIHFFSGTQKRNAGQIREELQMLDGFLKELSGETNTSEKSREANKPVRKRPLLELEYGPGLAVNYFTPDSRERTLKMFAETVDEVKQMTFGGPVTLEMGRGIAANCGYYLSHVRDIKVTDGTNVCILDGGIHQMKYDGQMMGMKHPQVSVLRESEPAEMPGESKPVETSEVSKKEWDVFGSLCSVHDILIKRYPLGELSVGDILVFGQTGAYSAMEGISLLLSHELPAVYGYDAEGGVRCLRERIELWPFNA